MAATRETSNSSSFLVNIVCPPTDFPCFPSILFFIVVRGILYKAAALQIDKN
jgi:hypothetical protein